MMIRQASSRRVAFLIGYVIATIQGCASNRSTISLELQPFSIDVAVRDASGHPVNSIPISLSAKRRCIEGTEQETVIETLHTDHTGCLRFDLSSAWAEHYCFPLTLWVGTIEQKPRIVVLNDRDDLSVSIELPPMSEVVLQVQDFVDGTVTLKSKQTQAKPMNRSLGRTDVEIKADGQARVRHIGLGQQLIYRVVCHDGSPDVLGEIEGPRTVGSIVKAIINNTGRRTIKGRFLDERGEPLSEAHIRRKICLETELLRTMSSNEFTTDAEGRFECPAYVGFEDPRPRLLSFRLTPQGSYTRSVETHCRFEGPIGDSVWNFGDLTMAAPTSTDYFAGLEDDTLQAKYELAILFGANDLRRACLSDMARRGGDRWVSLIKDELSRVSRERASSRNSSDLDRTSRSELRLVVPDLEYLTFLRRAEKQEDPVALILDPKSVLSSNFTVSPVAVFRLENRDPGGESFFVRRGGYFPLNCINTFRSVHQNRFRVEGKDEGGNPLEVLHFPWMVAHALPDDMIDALDGNATENLPTEVTDFVEFPTPHQTLLAPGGSIELTVPLAAYVDFRRPGTYRFHVSYYIFESFDSCSTVESTDRFIECPSEAFEVQMTKGRIKLSRGDAASIRQSIDEMLSSDEREQCTEEAITEKGIKAVPLLLDSLANSITKVDHEKIIDLLMTISDTLAMRLWRFDHRYPETRFSYSEALEDFLCRRTNFDTLIVD